jgi:8-oxo-dGTP pyrophosphatase MutT (NUDIX family)
MTVYVDPLGKQVERPTPVAPEWRVMCSAVAMRDGRVLMRQAVWSSLWEIPGGGVELANEESIVEAAIREVHEETGYTFLPDFGTLRFRGEQFFHIPSSGRYYHSLNFIVRGAASGSPDPVKAGESIRIEWVDPATIDHTTIHWFHLETLRDLGLTT